MTLHIGCYYLTISLVRYGQTWYDWDVIVELWGKEGE